MEEYLIERAAYLTKLGGGLGGILGGADPERPGRAGERGGRRNAERTPTVVEERTGQVALTPQQVGERVTACAPRAKPLPTPQVLRWAVPVGTGYTHIVVDVAVTADGDGSQVVLRAFGKDKLWLLAFGSTRRLADKLWSAIAQ